MPLARSTLPLASGLWANIWVIPSSPIIVFIFSPDFIASEECMKEWYYAQTLATGAKPLFRIPIIVRNCAWKDILKGDDVKALSY